MIFNGTLPSEGEQIAAIGKTPEVAIPGERLQRRDQVSQAADHPIDFRDNTYFSARVRCSAGIFFDGIIYLTNPSKSCILRVNKDHGVHHEKAL
jgi:hypothetical protein